MTTGMTRKSWTWKEDLTGKRFTRLVVLGFAERRGANYYWRCICDCRTEKVVGRSALISGMTKSCGCFNRERTSETQTTHGMSKIPEYRNWLAMMQRCGNPKAKGFVHYGGRGICVCERWQSFQNFYQDMGKRPDGYSLDRVDPEGNYEPSNCRWIAHSRNCAVKRKTISATFCGETKTLADWARHFSIPHTTLWQRVARYHWPIDRALTAPIRKASGVST